MSPEEIAPQQTALDNMRFYNQVAEVPKEACKDFKRAGGFQGTDINRMWRVAALTKLFGPAGVGWTFELTNITERKIDSSERVVLFAQGALRYKDPQTGEWSAPIIGYGGNDLIKVEEEKVYNSKFRTYDKTGNKVAVINDEAYKMVETDAFGAACSKLGVGASVYWKSGWSKYITESDSDSEEPAAIETPAPAAEVPRKADPFFGSSDKDKKPAEIFRTADQPAKEVVAPVEPPRTTPAPSQRKTNESPRMAQEKALDKAISKDFTICATLTYWLSEHGKENTDELTDEQFEQMLLDMGVQL